MSGPLRKVLIQKVTPQGSKLHLECGHGVWLAGVHRDMQQQRCMTGPCYKLERFMGK